MLNWSAPVLCCAALLSASGASAQLASPPAAPPYEAAPATDEEIVVSGRTAIPPEGFDEAISKFVRDLGQPGPIDPISRWGGPFARPSLVSPRRSAIS